MQTKPWITRVDQSYRHAAGLTAPAGVVLGMGRFAAVRVMRWGESVLTCLLNEESVREISELSPFLRVPCSRAPPSTSTLSSIQPECSAEWK